MGPAILIDDADPKLKPFFQGTQWSLQPTAGDGFLNGTMTVCKVDPATGGSPAIGIAPSLSQSFYGSDFAFYGPGQANVGVNYTIDGSTLRPADLNTSAPTSLKSGVKLFSLTNLDTRYHTVKLSPSAGSFSFDYFVYTPTKSTSLTGANIIVDDADSSAGPKYSGTWVKSSTSAGTLQAGTLGGLPYGETLSGTSTNGAGMRFDFVGSSITVYGALNQQAGKLSASFQVDNGTATTFAPYDGTQTASTNTWKLYQKFFQKGLGPGSHSLYVTLLEATGSQTLYLDALSYEGSAGTVLSSSSSSTTSTSNPNTTSKKGLNGAEIGGIIAAIVSFSLFFMCLKRWCRTPVYPWNAHTNVTVVNERPQSTYVPPPAPAPPPPMPHYFNNLTNPSFLTQPQMASRHDPYSNPTFNPHPSPPANQTHNSWTGYPQPSSQPQTPYMAMPTPMSVNLNPEYNHPPSAPEPAPAPAPMPPAPAPPPPSVNPALAHHPEPQPEEDAGPAVPPPPYNEANYIP